MSDIAKELAFTELEALEVARRNDLASAVIPAAVRLFSKRTDLWAQLKTWEKRSPSKWHLVFLAGGLALHFVESGTNWTFDTGTAIVLATGLNFYQTAHHKDRVVERLGTEVSSCDDQLSQLEVVWRGATGYDTFNEIREFAGEFGLDEEDKKFRDWWAEHRKRILVRACGYEKGEKMAKDEAERITKFDAAMRDLRKPS